jgi:hypothetical protein
MCIWYEVHGMCSGVWASLVCARVVVVRWLALISTLEGLTLDREGFGLYLDSLGDATCGSVSTCMQIRVPYLCRVTNYGSLYPCRAEANSKPWKMTHGKNRVILHLILEYCNLICLKFIFFRYCYLLDQHILVLMPKMCHLLYIASTLCIPGWPLTWQLEYYLHCKVLDRKYTYASSCSNQYLAC